MDYSIKVLLKLDKKSLGTDVFEYTSADSVDLFVNLQVDSHHPELSQVAAQ